MDEVETWKLKPKTYCRMPPVWTPKRPICIGQCHWI